MPRKSRRRTREQVHVKLRVVTLRRMKKGELVRKLKQAIRTRMVPEGIELAYIDWSKEGRSGHLSESQTIGDDAADELHKIYAMMRAGGRWRIENVRTGERLDDS